MKTLDHLRFSVCILSLTALLSACSTDVMHPEDKVPDAAFENSESTDHLSVAPQCSPSTFATLLDLSGSNAGGMESPQTYGVVEVANSPQYLHVIVRAGYGWQVQEACFWSGTSAPTVVNGQVNANSFSSWWSSSTIQSGAMMTRPLTDFTSTIHLMVHARLCQTDFYGNPANFTEVWATGAPIGNAYTLTFSPVYCTPPPVNPDPVTLTGGSCTQCNSENSVTFDPADPNCVEVSSCKNLSNVVLQMSDCSTYKYDNLTGHTGNFCSPNGLSIVKVWVKSGCNQSGEGPGYGRRFNNPFATVTCP
jgi:hypothetical protein